MKGTYNMKVMAGVLGAATFVAVAILVITLFTGTTAEPEVIIGSDNIEITGQYGVTYALADIKGIELRDSIPAITYKANGASLGSNKKGDFDVEGMGRCRLFVNTDSSPFIIMQTSGGYVILNFESPDKTRETYDQLLKAIGDS